MITMTKERICRRCKSTFKTTNNSVICSDCRVGICAVCGAEFRRLGEAFYVEWCSKDCKSVYYKQHGFNPQGMRYRPKKCKICGEEFIPKSPHDSYCGNDHFRPCPICGKLVKFSSVTEPVKGCSKECKNEILRRTSLERFGVDNPAKSEEVKNKLRNSFNERYKDVSFRDSNTYKKRVATNRAKYGCDNPFSSPEIRKKSQDTLEKKTGYREPLQLPHVREALDKYIHDPIHAREIAIKRTATRNRFSSLDGTCFDSSYEVDVYEFCKRNNISVETQIYATIHNISGIHKTLYDFKIEDTLYECKGGHLLDGCWDNTSVSIQDKVDSYMENNVILITDVEEGFPALELHFSQDIVAIDVELFRIFYSTGFKDNTRYQHVFESEMEIWNLVQELLNRGTIRVVLDTVVQYKLSNS